MNNNYNILLFNSIFKEKNYFYKDNYEKYSIIVDNEKNMEKKTNIIIKNIFLIRNKNHRTKINSKEIQIYKINSFINSIFKFIIIFILFPFVLLENKKTRNLDYRTSISLYNYEDGEIYILSPDFENLPDEIKINDQTKSPVSNFYEFSSTNVKIQLIWYSEIRNCSSMFSKCTSIKKIDFSDFDSSNVIDMSKMFYQCSNLEEINFNNFITSSVKYMNSMFKYVSTIQSIDLSNFDTSKVIDMESMFDNCFNLLSIDLSSFETSSVTTMYSMFYNCNKLTTIDLSNFNTKSLTNIGKMFRTCQQLESFDFSNFDTSKITKTAYLFESCTNLQSINFTNFNSSSIKDMSYMFRSCKNIKYLNLSNFDLSNVELASLMFADCHNLEEIYFNDKYKMANATDTYKMFKTCKKLKSLDLSFIDTSKVTIMDYMFNGCIELEIINIPNFNTISANTMSFIFSNCNNLKYLNAYSVKSKTDLDSEYNKLPDNLTYCINENEENIISILNEKNCINNCTNLCNFLNLKIINSNKNKCFTDCIHDELNQFEYNNKCYYECPGGTQTLLNSNLCLDIFDDTTIPTQTKEDTTILTGFKEETTTSSTIPTEYNEVSPISSEIKENQENPIFSSKTTNIDEKDSSILTVKNEENIFSSYINEKDSSILTEKKEDNIFFFFFKDDIINEDKYNFISNNCTINDFLNKKCIEEYDSNESIKNIIDIIKHNIENKNIKLLLDQIVNEKEEYIIEQKRIIYQLTSSYNLENNKHNNLSTIKFGECENKLKKHYNISENETLIIFKIDYYEEGLLIPLIEYEVYHPLTYQKLNLDVCDKEKIEISIAVDINEEELYKYDPKSQYYNDKCFPGESDNGTDIILTDRQNEYVNNNLSLCENNCQFNRYDNETKRVLCECEVKKEIKENNIISGYRIDKEKILNSFININNIMNLYILKCYEFLLTKKGLLYNIGSYILLSIISFNIISVFLFVKKGLNYFKTQMESIMGAKILNKKNITNKTKEKSKTKKNKKDKSNKKSKFKKQYKNNNKNNNNKNNKNNKKSDPPNKKKKSFKSNNKKFNKDSTYKSIFIKDKIINSNSLFSNKNENVIIHKTKTLQKNNNDKFLYFNDYELNAMSYNDALKYDKRTYFEYYLSLLRTKHLLVFTFFSKKDYNSNIIKINLFFFSLALYFTINALFYTDTTIHDIYEDSGAFNFIYHVPQILYSSIISAVINAIIKFLSLSEKNILEIKKEKNMNNYNNKIQNILRCLKIKFIFFYILYFLFLIFFWYYLSCFCAVYQNTQFHLIIDTLFSFFLSLLYPLGINLIPGFFRIPALKDPKSNQKCLYGFSKIIQII